MASGNCNLALPDGACKSNLSIERAPIETLPFPNESQEVELVDLEGLLLFHPVLPTEGGRRQEGKDPELELMNAQMRILTRSTPPGLVRG